MEFQLLQGASRYNPCFGYDDDDFESDTFVDPSDVELDEIILIRNGKEIEIGGRARIKDMAASFEKYGVEFAMYATRILSDYAFFLDEVGPPCCHHKKLVEGFEKHFETLLKGGVAAPIKVCDLRKARFYSGYFSVLKSNSTLGTQVARSIFNGKKLSLGCKVPPGTNLPDFMRLLEALTKLVKDNGAGFHSIVADVRHAFHQIPLGDEMSFFFAIARLLKDKNEIWRWLSLPMGWSWSPFLCQSIGFGLLLIILEKAGLDVTVYKMMTVPPPLILISDKDSRLRLVVALWYDNIGVFTCDGSLANTIAALIPKVFEKGHHYYLKDFLHLGPSGLYKSAKRHPEYLGVNFRQSAKRTEDGQFICVLEWQPTTKKRAKWNEIVINCVSTCRRTAKALGVILWANRLAYIPLCRLERELDVLRRASDSSNTGGGWDTQLTLTVPERELLRHDLTAACSDEWRSKPVDLLENMDPIFIATDSSKPKWAYLFWTSYRGTVTEAPRSGCWKDFGDHPTIGQASIFIKELLTAVLAIEAVTKLWPRRKIVLFIDNTAAAGVIRRMASTTAYGNELARRIDAALQDSGCHIVVVTILSEHNPADSPTRNKPICSQRVEAMWIAWDDFQRGVLQSRPNKKIGTSLQLRHLESESAEDFDSDDDISDSDERWPDISVGEQNS